MGAISLTRSITAFAVLVAAAAVVAVAGFIPASASYTTIRPHPLATLLVASDATAIFAAVNTNGSGSGIIGQSGPSFFGPAAGAGVFGIFNQSAGVGEGLLGFSQNGAGVVAENFGGSQAALYAQNFSGFAGPAIQGLSNGNAVVGTSNNTNSIVGITNAPGSGVNSAVLGEDMANNGLFNNGVTGTTTSDGWGVQGTSTNGALGGVEGVATNATGVEGFTTSGIGVFGTSNPASVVGNIQISPGVSGQSSNASGVYGNSTNRNGGAFENNNPTYFTLFARANNASTSPLNVINVPSGASMTFDASGNLTITGKIFTAGSCSVGCSSTRHPLTYAASQSLPTMEDFGEAQLVNGQAYVRLDPAYANVIDRQSNYLVFITPEGDSNGVYVSQKSPSGFLVRENRGGHSMLAFSYRIVAKPFADHSARLPILDNSARLAALRAGTNGSLPATTTTTQQSAVAAASQWSAAKRAIANNPWLAKYKVDKIPGPPGNVIKAAAHMKLIHH